MIKNIALITGITGQDGSYLAAFLLDKKYEVHGITRNLTETHWRHDYLGITDALMLHAANLEDEMAIRTLLADIQPTEIYHLAAESSVAASLADPYPTLRFNIQSTLALLNATRAINSNIRFFNASSAEIFDANVTQPLTLESPFKPNTPYGISKLTGHTLVQKYRHHSNLFAVNGILFPHESPLRLETSFFKSVIRNAVACKRGTKHAITLGYIDTERDFGDATQYVKVMWKSLQVIRADDYIIATGIPTSLRVLVMYIMDKLELPASLLETTRDANRPLPKTIYGDPTETCQKLDWTYTGDVFATIDAMIAFETVRTSTDTL